MTLGPVHKINLKISHGIDARYNRVPGLKALS